MKISIIASGGVSFSCDFQSYDIPQNENPNHRKRRGIIANSWNFQCCEYPSKSTTEAYPSVTSNWVFATNKNGKYNHSLHEARYHHQ